MKPSATDHRCIAFALRELIVIVIVAASLLCMLLVGLSNARQRAERIGCTCNLKQIALSFKLWEGDHKGAFPMAVSTNFGGTAEYQVTEKAFRHFQRLSNELSTPKVIVCPSDTRVAAKDFGGRFSNTNLSYFVGLDAAGGTHSQMFLSGDRNITNGLPPVNGVLLMTSNSLAGWTHEMHRVQGNIALADGSVQQFTTTRMREALNWTEVPTKRLALP